MSSRLLVSLLLVLLAVHMLHYGACTQDDAFISFRYAANLIAGDGLVYNPGEPVEGYTNFLWTVLMALPIGAGWDPVLASVIGGMLSALALALAGWRLAAVLLDSPWVGLLVVAFIAMDSGLALEAMQGLETLFYAALLSWALVFTHRELEDPNAPPISALLLGLAALTRPEGALVFAGIGLARWALAGRLDRRLKIGIGLFVVVVVGHLLFRLTYYGAPLPNTFYAKVGTEGAQLTRGMVYIAAFAAEHLVLCALALIGGGMVLLRWSRQTPTVRIMLGFTLTYLLYVMAVGGDFKETFRFIIPVMVPLTLLAGIAVSRLPQIPLAVAVVVLAALGLDARQGIPRASEAAVFRANDMDQRLEIGVWLRDNVSPESVLAVHSAGTIPYAAGLYTIDMWGLSDPHIARREIADMGTGTAGHEKTDYDYTFRRDPDLYLPEELLLTDEPARLPVPADFPADFEERYKQLSVQIGAKWLNFFRRQSPSSDR